MNQLKLEIDRADLLSCEKDGRVRVLLIAINMIGYYSLPVRLLALAAMSEDDIAARFDVRYIEFTIEEDVALWARHIAAWEPDIIGLSLNIWNRNAAIHLAEDIKQLKSQITVLVGGQEVTNSVMDYLSFVQAFDYIIDGEGEIPFRQFLNSWDVDRHRPVDEMAISGLHYRKGLKSVFSRPAELLSSLDDVPSPILAGLIPAEEKGALGVMIEGSRGCPFKCAFCFEGGCSRKVRFASIERIRKEISYMVQRGANYFHMMDPILCQGRIERLRMITDIFETMRLNKASITVSVEAYCEFMTEEMAKCMKAFSIIDIGLQTVNPRTLAAINRTVSTEVFCEGIRLLMRTGSTVNIYLISGLPYETPLSFLEGVEFVLERRPTRIFFNELCLLNGTELRRRAEEYGYIFDDQPPYRVRGNACFSRTQLTYIQAMGKDIERRYNLSMRSVFHDAPWTAGPLQDVHDAVRLRFHGSCGRGCSGCVRVVEGNVSGKECEDAPFDRMCDANIELLLGDNVDRVSIMRLVGSCRLAGAARIRSICPPSFFEDTQLLEKLARGGIWQFRTFLSAKDFDLSRVASDAFSDLAYMAKAFKVLSKRYSFSKHGAVRPYVELVICAEGMSQRLVADVALWGMEAGASSVMVQGLPDDQVVDLPVMNNLLTSVTARQRWIRFPMETMRSVLDSCCFTDIDRLLNQMGKLELLSDSNEQPPCYQPCNEVLL